MGVILKPQRTRMSEYVTGLLEETGYRIQSSDQSQIVFVSRNPKAHPEPAHLFLHSAKKTVGDFKHEMNNCIHQGHYVANLFYKDGENFHVRLAEEANAKEDKSLKKYSKDDLDDMLRLRGLEKFVLSRMRQKQTLTYYQPETKQLHEGIRDYRMENVWLDYSHISPDSRSYDFVENRVADDFKIAKELQTDATHLRFTPIEKHLKILAIIPPRYN